MTDEQTTDPKLGRDRLGRSAASEGGPAAEGDFVRIDQDQVPAVRSRTWWPVDTTIWRPRSYWGSEPTLDDLAAVECGRFFDAVRVPERLGERIFATWGHGAFCGPVLHASPWMYFLTMPNTDDFTWKWISDDCEVLRTGRYLICPRPGFAHPAAGVWLRGPETRLFSPTMLANIIDVFEDQLARGIEEGCGSDAGSC
jgi:hypothetical protein